MARWAPINLTLLQHLKPGILHSKVDAALVLASDLLNGVERSAREYAKLWAWSPDKARRFLNDTENVIILSQATNETGKASNDKGLWVDTSQQQDKMSTKVNKSKTSQQQATNETGKASNDAGLQSDTSQMQVSGKSTARRLFIKEIKIPSLAASPPSKRPPSGNHQTFVAWWCMAYEITQDKPYLFAAKDAKATKTLLGLHPIKHLILIASHFLTVEDAFLANRRDLPMLQSQINRMPPPGEIMAGNAARFRAAGLLPPDDVLFEDWTFWEIEETTTNAAA